jgi:DNA-binding XRE family transcriptional regulator
MDLSRLSHRTRDALEKLPAEKKRHARDVIAWTQTEAARAQDKADREALDHEFRSTGRIAVTGDHASPEDLIGLRGLIEALRKARQEANVSLDELARRAHINKAALSRLESDKQTNPTIAALARYARGLGLQLSFVLERGDGIETGDL